MRRLISLAGFAVPCILGAQDIPLKPGVMLTYATQPIDSTARDDFERDITVDTVTTDEVRLLDVAENQLKPSNKIGKLEIDRTVSHREATLAREIWLGNETPDLDQHRGTSWMALSNVLMKQLRANGQAEVTIGQTGFEGAATMTRVEPNPVPVSVLINGTPRMVPTMHTRITVRPSGLMQLSSGAKATYDFWFVDDTTMAWIVKYTGTETFNDTVRTGDRQVGLQQLVRVEWGDMGTAKAMGAMLGGKTCRVPVYGIHFATGSAVLTASSTPTLKQVADLLKQNSTWVVTIEGHTDSVGGAAYNKDLSERRSAAVRTALVTSYGIPAARLSTTGYGLTRPVDKNSTLAGRARNRRVELARKC